MTTYNSRLGVLYLGAVTAIPVTKNHGLSISMPIDFSEDTSLGDDFKSYLPGLRDFKVSIERWYDNAYNVMADAVAARTLLKFYLYPHRADTGSYWHGSGYLSLETQDVTIGSTVSESFSLVNGSSSTAWVHA